MDNGVDKSCRTQQFLVFITIANELYCSGGTFVVLRSGVYTTR